MKHLAKQIESRIELIDECIENFSLTTPHKESLKDEIKFLNHLMSEFRGGIADYEIKMHCSDDSHALLMADSFLKS